MLADGGSGRATSVRQAGLQAVSDWRRVIEAADIDLVVVAVPPDRHAAITLAALEAGKHVLVEKPFGADAAQAQAMAEARSRSGTVGAVGFQFRFEPHLRALSAAVKAGRIGAVRRVELSWQSAGRADPATPWSWQNDREAGGGVVNAFASHALDLVQWLAGAPIAAVGRAERQIVIAHRPHGNGRRAVTAEDRVGAELALEHGITAGLDICNCRRDGDGMRITVHGESGTLTSHQRPPFRPQDAQVILEPGGALPIPLPAGWPEGDSRLGAAIGLSCALVAAITGDGTPDYPDFNAGQSVRRVLDTLLAAPCAGPDHGGMDRV